MKLNFGTVLGSPRTDFWTVSGPCVLFFLCVVARKMNNMLVVCISCCYMLN